MDDQFGGRTDDDLFYDDFEPVESAPVVIDESNRQTANARDPTAVQTSSAIPPSRSLASSRFADKPIATAAVPAATASAPTPASTVTNATAYTSSGTDAGASGSASPPLNAPTAPSSRDQPQYYQQQQQQHHHHQRPPRAPSQNTAASAEARLKSGANPRQKLTEEELAAKMEKMKLLAAEKTRKFQMAEQDERQHAEAYARGMEEARRRRTEEAERRRRADDERRKLDDERARNRERKLKAMGMKDGGWDEGKEAAAEEEARRSFRGANGGIRGAKGGAASGLGTSRYARGGGADRPDVDRFLGDRHGPRGRGRGGRGSGPQSLGRDSRESRPQPKTGAPVLTTDEFPALPSAGPAKKEADGSAAPASAHEDSVVPPLPTPPAGGKWDDEMEALDAVGKAT
ncbi:hypothetical protein CDD83_7109 [Cordyceps sp. RAO-2017]|nr:hypothetical protein CDD83_7109 [Cordyceps sp. RAO-2017]